MREEGYTHGINAIIENIHLKNILTDLYHISHQGLKKRKQNEEKIIEPLLTRIENKIHPSDITIKKLKQGKQSFLNYLTITSKNI